MTVDDSRSVLVRESLHLGRSGVTATPIPEATLREVFGDVTPDPRVAHLVLSFESYGPGLAISKTYVYNRMLPVLRTHLSELNAYRFVSLLAKRGVADDFFDLASTSVDRTGELRAILMSNGVLIDTIRHYSSWSGINPREFTNGFVFGVAESFANVVFDLADLVALIARVWRAQLRFLFNLATDPTGTVESLPDQIAVVGQIVDALLGVLDPSRLPSALLNLWRGWNAEFERRLENLDAFGAGHHLGNIAGTLWDLLTGMMAMASLLKVAGREILRYSSLLAGRTRSLARESVAVLQDLAQALRVIGRNVLDALPRVGLGVLHTLFPPPLMRKLAHEGRSLLTFGDLSIISIPQVAFAQAFDGARMPNTFAAVIADRGKPVAMAVTSRGMSPGFGYTPDLHQQAMESIDETLDRLDSLFREIDSPPKSALDDVMIQAQILQDLEQRLTTHLAIKVQEVAYEEFHTLRRSRKRFEPRELGRKVDDRMKSEIPMLLKGRSPSLKDFNQRSIATVYRELAANPKVAWSLSPNGRNLLDQDLATFVSNRPDLMTFIGISETPSARTRDAVSRSLKRFKWKDPSTAPLGSLVSDLGLADLEAKRFVNIDYTSSTNSDRHGKFWGQVADDLGIRFNGQPDKILEAYRKAGKPVPKQVSDGLKDLTWHAIRETVIRKVILQEILGGHWEVTSHEMLYGGLARQWAAIPPK